MRKMLSVRKKADEKMFITLELPLILIVHTHGHC